MNRLLIVVLFSTSALFSMEEAPMVNVVPPRKLRLTELYQQLRPQAVEPRYYEVSELVRLLLLMSENRAYLAQLKAEDSDAKKIAELKEEIRSVELIIKDLQLKFDETRSARERYRFSK